MNDWFSSKELAGLTGMAGTPQNVTARAKREDWQFRARHAQGGGKEYHISSLPLETQAALRQKASDKPERAFSVVEVKGERISEAEERAQNSGLTRDELALLQKYRQMDQQQKIQAQTIVDVIAQPKVKESNER